MKAKARDGRTRRASGETERHRKRPLTTAPPQPVTITVEEAARHVDMSPRALLRWLEKLNAACLVRLSPRRRRIDRRSYFRLLERHGLGGPPHAA
jgi:hypothetical protein